MLLNDNNNLIKKVTFFYDSKNTNMAGPPSSQSELSYEHTYVKVTINFTVRAHQLWQLCGNWRSKALLPPDRFVSKGWSGGRGAGGVAARTPPTASAFRDKGGLGSTQKRIRYCVSVTYICDGIEHMINRIFKKKENGNQEYILKFWISLLIYSLYSLFN